MNGFVLLFSSVAAVSKLNFTDNASRRRVEQLEAAAVAVALVPAAADGRVHVQEIAVLLVGEERDAVREHVVDDAVGDTSRAPCSRSGSSPSSTSIDASGVKLGARLVYLMHAERRVLAEQRALRAAQDLDALEVGEVLIRHADVAHEHVVDDHADGRFHVVVAARLADTADRHAGAARVRRRRRQARRALREIGDRERAIAIDLRAADHGDRHRHVLRALRAVARGDDDLFDRAGRDCGGLGARRCLLCMRRSRG